MASIAASPASTTKPARKHSDLHHEHLFFWACLSSCHHGFFFGFARTYYLAGSFSRAASRFIIHNSRAAFTAAILLLVTQTSLVASDHRHSSAS